MYTLHISYVVIIAVWASSVHGIQTVIPFPSLILSDLCLTHLWVDAHSTVGRCCVDLNLTHLWAGALHVWLIVGNVTWGSGADLKRGRVQKTKQLVYLGREWSTFSKPVKHGETRVSTWNTQEKNEYSFKWRKSITLHFNLFHLNFTWGLIFSFFS